MAIHSVSQVNKFIKSMFDRENVLRGIMIRGEISNFKCYPSGHCYFTLKDAGGALKAVMFKSRAQHLRFQPVNGLKVVASGTISVYERDGVYQVYARKIELDGEGNLYLKFEQLKKELEEMGMFAEEYKQPIPKYARTIGVVTAPTGAAVQDIRNIAGRRNPYVQLILYPALVQGEGAAPSIVNGIHALEHLGVDVIIVGRGGGSIEDLWAFNEEIVARAIFECSVPVISAVGHQTDWTIADYVADLRAPTPSAAAELAVYDYAQTQAAFTQIRQQLDRELRRKLTLSRTKLEQQKMRLRYLSPQNRLNENRRRTLEYEEKLAQAMNTLLKERRHQLSLLAGTLESYSPAKKLSMGYAFVQAEDGHALRSVKQVEPKDEITVHLLDGEISATVLKKNPKENK